VIEPLPDPLEPGDIEGQNPNTPERMPGHAAYYARRSPRDFLQRNKLAIFTVVFLVALLAWAIWTMVQMWTSVEGPMGTHETIAMALGIFFSCLVGFGLMALMFYSSRMGYDEAPTYTQDADNESDHH
jgi:hypothetical protein